MSAAHRIGTQEPLVPVGGDWYLVRVAGAVKPLYMSPGPSWCGTITDGVALRFGDTGGDVVISLEALKRFVAVAEARQQAFRSAA